MVLSLSVVLSDWKILAILGWVGSIGSSLAGCVGLLIFGRHLVWSFLDLSLPFAGQLQLPSKSSHQHKRDTPVGSSKWEVLGAFRCPSPNPTSLSFFSLLSFFFFSLRPLFPPFNLHTSTHVSSVNCFLSILLPFALSHLFSTTGNLFFFPFHLAAISSIVLLPLFVLLVSVASTSITIHAATSRVPPPRACTSSRSSVSKCGQTNSASFFGAF